MLRTVRRSLFRCHVAAAALCLLAPLAHGRSLALEGQVIAVHDGDTVTLLDGTQVQHRVRIAGIDAPERGQPFGMSAKESLARLAHGRRVEAHCHKRDRFGREVCNVFVEGRDVGLEQVRNGLAWWYREYAREQRLEDRTSYEAAEGRRGARGAGSGAIPIRRPLGRGAGRTGRAARPRRPEARGQRDRVSGTNRTGIVRFVAVEPSGRFSMTSSSCTCHCAPTGMTRRPPGFS